MTMSPKHILAALSYLLVSLSILGGCAATTRTAKLEVTPEPYYIFQPPSAEELAAVQYPALREELLDMVEHDQRTRKSRLASDDSDFDSFVARLTKVDRKNTARMHEIVDEVGWPTKSKVGSDGTQAAWLLVQHADLDVPFQHRCLNLMQDQQIFDEVYAQNLAYLTDRVLVNEGKEQEYGTQFHDVDGKPQPRPIRDAKNVDKRRKEMGLSTLDEYRKLMKT